MSYADPGFVNIKTNRSSRDNGKNKYVNKLDLLEFK